MGDKVKWILPNPRMDDLMSTVNDCGNELAIMNKRFEETAARKAQLQRTLARKRERTVALRAEVHALRAKEGELEEQEKLELNRIEEYNEALKASSTRLDKIRDRETELRKLIVHKVSEFEEDSCSIAGRFQSLQLVDQDECGGSKVNVVTEANVTELQEEVARLEAEEKALASAPSGLPLDELKNLVREVNIELENLKEVNQTLVDKEASLKNTLQQLGEENHS